MSLETCGWLILLFPLGGTVLIAFTSQILPSKVHGVIGTLAIALAFVCAVGALFQLQDLGEEERQVTSVAWDYANTVGVDAQLSILLDPLAIFMALVVTGISTLIHLYSVAYMRSDRGYTRFFAYLNFFVFSMLLLVLAGNFFFLIVGWAFVGAASYLLISFWYRRTTATRAGIKAFVINVVGDVGLVLGTYFIFKTTGTLDFLGAFESAGDFAVNDGDLVAGCLLLLVGAFAKSAQVPLHTWLPDAMEGPTPVSALIHAATMVTAGVYLIARMHPFFEQAPAAADVGAIIGCVTLLIAATIALVVTDLKRVIAYSTMSQIGYMIMGVASFAYVGGLFHLMTHAFFKALLFMAAGSVISAMASEQNLDKMGGFKKRDAVHVRVHGDRRPVARRRPAVRGLLLEGRDPRPADHARRLVRRARRARLRRRVHDRDLHVADDLPRLLRAAGRAGARARGGPHLPRARADEPGDRRGRGHRRRLPRPGPPDRRARVEHEGRDGRAGAGRDLRRLAAGRARDRGDPRLPRADVPRPRPTTRSSSRPNGATWGGWVAGTVLSLGGIFLAWQLWVVDRERAPRHRAARAARRASTRCSRTSGTSTRSSTRSSSGRSRCSAASRVTCSSAS